MKAGLNLYTIHKFLDTEEHFLAAAMQLKEMGCSYLQYSGGPYEPERIRRVSEAAGLPIVLTHVPADRILNDKPIETTVYEGAATVAAALAAIRSAASGKPEAIDYDFDN